MPTTIHPLACVDPAAQLADGVDIGPFCVVGPHVTLGPGTRLLHHASVVGHTTLGARNTLHPHSVVGGAPQDLKYRGEPTRVEIGDDNTLREFVTINSGTIQDKLSGGVTRLGSRNLLMTNAHLGHDVQVGNANVIANNVMVAGHCHCGDHVVMNGGAALHHFVTVGDFAYLAGYCRIHHDVPPFVKVAGDDEIRALNEVGLRRAGYAEPDIAALDEAFRSLFSRRRPMAQAMADFHLDNGINPHVKRLVQFLERRATGKHGRHLESLRAK